MAESGSEGEFRVTDRRRRADAEVAPADAAGVSPADLAEVAPAEGADVTSTPSQEVTPPSVEPPPRRAPAAPSAAPGDSGPVGRGERTLESLFVMLASSALMALGQAADPATGQGAEADPPAAADVIDLLVLLREKTEGHRTPGEGRLLDGLIYDLQLRYVAATKPGL